MTVIEASSGTYRSRVDGTIVLSVEIEPRFRAEALALFGMPGTPMALAALKPAIHEPGKADKPKGGLLSQWCAMRCDEVEFHDWLREHFETHWWSALKFVGADHGKVKASDVAAECVRRICGVKSRAEFDHDPRAAARFDQYVRHPWQKHYMSTQTG